MYYKATNDYNDCISKGACSISPKVAALQEVLFIIIRQITYYLVELRKLGVVSQKADIDLVTLITVVDLVKEFSENQLLELYSNQYKKLVQVRKEYLKVCNQINKDPKDVNNLLKLNTNINLSIVLKRGEEEFIKKNKKLINDKKFFAEILRNVIKSVCNNLIDLADYSEFDTEISKKIFEAINIFNSSKISVEKIKFYVDLLANSDLKLLNKINKCQYKHFGFTNKVQVSHSTRPNKAIMVTGSNLNDLKILLETIKTTNIDVYTNGDLLVAHSFAKFGEYKNLRGHYGTGIFNTILDFATFPGAILLSKNESKNIEYLYRGRLFTTDEIAPSGVVKVDRNNFALLIESSLQAKGFAKGKNKEPEVVGFDRSVLLNEFQKISETDYDEIYIIGPSNLSTHELEHIKKYFENNKENIFVLSFSYIPRVKNVISINIGNNYPLLFDILKEFFNYVPLNSDKLNFLITKCDINSLSGVIGLKNNGAKNIYMSDCPPLMINPTLLNAFMKFYDIKEMKE